MKIAFTIVFFLSSLLSFSNLFAGSGESYIYEIEVSYNRSKVRGYVWFDLPIGEEEKVFASDSVFKEIVLNKIYTDTLDIYKEVYFVDSLDLQIYFKDKLVRVLRKDINRISYKRRILTGWGNWTSMDRFTTADLSWLKKKYMRKERLSDEACDIDIYFFEKPEKSILDEIDRFKKDNTKDRSQRLFEFLQKLEKMKVVVRQYCSC